MKHKCEFCGEEEGCSFQVTVAGVVSRIYRCSNCLACHMSPKVPEEELTKFYAEEYFLGLKSERYKARLLAEDYFKKVVCYNGELARECRILEIGPGYGYFGSKLKSLSLGLDIDVLEPSKICAEHIRAITPQIKIFENFEKIKEGTLKYDYIFAFHVLEHLQEARIFLDNIQSNLKPKGRFIALTPNASSRSFLKYGANWGWSCFGQHTQFFSEKIPEEFYRKHGFVPVLVKSVVPHPIHFPSKIHSCLQGWTATLQKSSYANYLLVRIIKKGLRLLAELFFSQNRRFMPLRDLEAYANRLGDRKGRDELILVLEKL